MDSESPQPDPPEEHETAAASPSDLAPNEPASLPATEEQKALPLDDDEPDAGEAVPPDDSSSVTSSDGQEYEEIAGYTVHPLASKFPLMTGKAFDDLVEAAAHSRRLHAVETNAGLLIDGRNRLRAQEKLRRDGIEIEVPVVEWEPTGGETVEEHIWAVNAHRRHLTDDQRVALALEFLPTIEAARQAKQEASRFGQRGSAAAAATSPPPDGQAGTPRRTSAEKDAASTVGGLAKLGGVTQHKARQARDLAKAVEKGEVSQSAIDAVVAGATRLRDVARPKRGSKNKPKPQKQDEHDEEVLIPEANPIACEAEVRRRWEEQKAEFAIADHRELRRLFLKVIREEQQEFDQ